MFNFEYMQITLSISSNEVCSHSTSVYLHRHFLSDNFIPIPL